MQLCLVFRRDGFAADVGFERDQKCIEFNGKSFRTRCLAIAHLVAHVAQVVVTFQRTVRPLVG